MPSTVTYVPNTLGFFAEFQTTGGMVGRDLAKRGTQLTRLAQRQVGKKTMALWASLGWHFGVHGKNDLMVTVGSNSKIALIHHNGTRAHVIRPRRTGALRFRQGGRIVYARRVFHPGTKPNRYLTDNLPRVVLT
jgi:hypothetical protein